jgi:hypothetical protein
VIAALVAALVVSAVSTQQHLVDERVHVAALSDDLTAAKADLNSTSAELVQAQDRETETVSNLVTCRSLGPVSTHLLAALKSMTQARLDRVDGAHDTHGGPIDDSKAELDAATKATSDAGYDALPELVDACKGTGTGSGA